MKNVLILLVFLVVGYGGWQLLTQPIGGEIGIAEVEDTPEKKPTKKSSTKSQPTPKTETREKGGSVDTKPVSKPSSRKMASMFTHYYDYGTNSKLEIQTVERPSLAHAMSKKPKSYSYTGRRAPKGWETDFYNLFLNAPEDVEILEHMAEQFTRKGKELGVSPVELAIAYVQGAIDYDHRKASLSTFKLQYPYETIYLKKGVCADKTILLSKLLTLLDYKHVLFEFPRAEHMALGLKVPSKYDNFNTGYAFVETTSYTPIGYVPNNYVQGIKINEKPSLIYPKQNGKRTFIQMGSYKQKNDKLADKYGEGYQYGTTTQKQLAIQMEAVKKKMEKMKKDHARRRCAERTVKTDEEMEICIQLSDGINQAVDEYNNLVKKFNKE